MKKIIYLALILVSCNDSSNNTKELLDTLRQHTDYDEKNIDYSGELRIAFMKAGYNEKQIRDSVLKYMDELNFDTSSQMNKEHLNWYKDFREKYLMK